MVSLLVAQVNLAFQTSLFILLAIGFLLGRKRKIKVHAQLMLAAVVLNLASFFAIMAPAMSMVIRQASSSLVALGMLHGAVGAVALLLGLWVVGSWLLSPLMTAPVKARCYSTLNKKLMWAVLFSWLASLVLGYLLYMTLYAGFLGG